VISGDVGVRKATPEVYTKGARAIDLAPEWRCGDRSGDRERHDLAGHREAQRGAKRGAVLGGQLERNLDAPGRRDPLKRDRNAVDLAMDCGAHCVVACPALPDPAAGGDRTLALLRARRLRQSS
jgi:hypothetical protein